MRRKKMTLIFAVLINSCVSKVSIVDLSHDYTNEGMVYYPTRDVIKPFTLTRALRGKNKRGVYWEVNNFCTGEHTGTHMDAPRHSIPGGRSIDQLKLEELIGEAVNLDITAKTMKNADYQCTVQDIKDWEKRYGEIPRGSFFFLNTGWHKYWPDKIRYIGSNDTHTNRDLHFPGIHPEAARWLVERRKIKMYGVDCISVDYGQTSVHDVHRILLSADIPVLENVANLSQLPPIGGKVHAIPMRIKEGSGAPARVYLLLENQFRECDAHSDTCI